MVSDTQRLLEHRCQDCLPIWDSSKSLRAGSKPRGAPAVLRGLAQDHGCTALRAPSQHRYGHRSPFLPDLPLHSHTL